VIRKRRTCSSDIRGIEYMPGWWWLGTLAKPAGAGQLRNRPDRAKLADAQAALYSGWWP